MSHVYVGDYFVLVW